jgi:hypothetical protein
MKELYYVWRLSNGKIANIAKRAKDGLYYAYNQKGKWEEQSNLKRIEFEVTDYERISEEEANKLIKEID